jgi:hypothetical protein
MRRRPSLITGVLFCAVVAAYADPPSPFPLWDSAHSLPASAGVPLLSNVRFSIIKAHEPEVDGYDWQHGVALIRYRDLLYASWGANKGPENSPGERVLGRVSRDDGRTWSPVSTIVPGEPERAASHGAYLVHDGRLWGFFCRFRGLRDDIQMEAYRLAEDGKWQLQATIPGGFWPLAEPVRMNDGNWIMAGFIIGKGNPGAVAISHRADFRSWDIVPIPKLPEMEMWGETALVVDGRDVLAITRYGAKGIALASVSHDAGRTWTTSQESNLSMATSKPYAGVLSTGQRYLIATTTADAGKRRSPLTIAVTRPGGKLFSRVYRIRDAVRPGETDTRPATLAYPSAIEYEGHLYVAYSVGRLRANRNGIELAVIPVSDLKAE